MLSDILQQFWSKGHLCSKTGLWVWYMSMCVVDGSSTLSCWLLSAFCIVGQQCEIPTDSKWKWYKIFCTILGLKLLANSPHADYIWGWSRKLFSFGLKFSCDRSFSCLWNREPLNKVLIQGHRTRFETFQTNNFSWLNDILVKSHGFWGSWVLSSF